MIRIWNAQVEIDDDVGTYIVAFDDGTQVNLIREADRLTEDETTALNQHSALTELLDDESGLLHDGTLLDTASGSDTFWNDVTTLHERINEAFDEEDYEEDSDDTDEEDEP